MTSGLAGRLIALNWLFDICRRQKSLDELFADAEKDPHWQSLEIRDRAFARSLLMTALRHKGEVDHILAQFLKKAPQAKTRVNEILCLGITQLLYMEVSDHAAIDTSVRLAKLSDKSRHMAKLVNAILRQVTRAKPDELVSPDGALCNIPLHWRKRWAKHYGEETASKIALASLEPAALDVMVKEDTKAWAEKLDGKIFKTASSLDKGYGFRKDHKGSITELDGFQDGAWWVQDFSAHLPCTLFEGTPGFGALVGKRVADLCAAPGGKTAALLTRGACVTAVDISENRLTRLRENLERLSLSAEIVQSDILAYSPEQKFEAILLDAPCSATGTIRRHPDILFLKNEELIFELKKLQRHLLEKAITFLKPGGILLYCTCSLEKEESEQQIDEFLASQPSVQRVPIKSEEVGGSADWLTKSGDVRLLPFFSPFEHDEWPGMDGFFISRLRLTD